MKTQAVPETGKMLLRQSGSGILGMIVKEGHVGMDPVKLAAIQE